MTSNADIARSMADNMTHSAVPLYGKRLRLPDRGAIIGIIKELRRLFFPAYFGDPQLMALPAENYAALLLERIETALTAQIALALPEDQSFAPREDFDLCTQFDRFPFALPVRYTPDGRKYIEKAMVL